MTERVENASDQLIRKRLDEGDYWYGFELKAIDGTSVLLDDTGANREKYPQSVNQKAGCGFPIMGIGGVLNLTKGTICAAGFSKHREHGVRVAHRILEAFNEGDLYKADRAYNSYGFVAQLCEKEVESVVLLNQRRSAKLD